MLNGIEKEFSNGEPWSFRQYSQLPPNLQLLVDQEQGPQDIWELPNQESDRNRLIKPPHQRKNQAFKLRLF
jgi:hypothetical protein